MKKPIDIMSRAEGGGEMKVWLMVMGFLYGLGFMVFEHAYESGILCFIFGILCGIWNSIDGIARKIKED